MDALVDADGYPIELRGRSATHAIQNKSALKLFRAEDIKQAHQEKKQRKIRRSFDTNFHPRLSKQELDAKRRSGNTYSVGPSNRLNRRMSSCSIESPNSKGSFYHTRSDSNSSQGSQYLSWDMDEEDYEQRDLFRDSGNHSCMLLQIYKEDGENASIVLKPAHTLKEIKKDLIEQDWLSERSEFSYYKDSIKCYIDAEEEQLAVNELLSNLCITSEIVDLFVDEDDELLGLEHYRSQQEIHRVGIEDDLIMILLEKDDVSGTKQIDFVVIDENNVIKYKISLQDCSMERNEDDETTVLITPTILRMSSFIVKFKTEEDCNEFFTILAPNLQCQEDDLTIPMEEIKEQHEKVDASENSRRFVVRKSNRYGIKQKRICWFDMQTQHFHIQDLHNKKPKQLDLNSVAGITIQAAKKAPTQLSVNFKNDSKNLKLTFASNEELEEFHVFCRDLLQSRRTSDQRIHINYQHDISNQKNPKRIRRFTHLNRLMPKSFEGQSDLSFRVMATMGNETLKIIMNFDTTMGQIKLCQLAEDQKIWQLFTIDEVQTLILSMEDYRTIKLVFNNRKKRDISIIFRSLRTKFFFCTHYYAKKMPTLKLRPGSSKIQAKDLKVFISSWNVGHTKCPPKSTIEGWLQCPEDYDIISLGIQECKKARLSEWLNLIKEHLEAADFHPFSIVTMWEMFLLVFIKKRHLHRITHKETECKAKGFAGVIGNKGGVYTSLKFDQTSFCFVSCHLAAQQGRWEQRNENYKDLVKWLKWKSDLEIDLTVEFDYLFWFGDLNYRVNRPFDEAVKIYATGNVSELWAFDQLTQQKAENQCFHGFNEGILDFLPTYRLTRDSPVWSNKKNQTPSWTDRILYRAYSQIDQLAYTSIPTCYGSDHRPIYGIFSVQTAPWFVPDYSIPKESETPSGHIKIIELTVEVNMTGVGYLQVQLNNPNFITDTSASDDVLAEEGTPTTFFDAQIEKLNTVINDVRYLQEQRIFLFVYATKETDNQQLIGHTSISLRTLMTRVAEQSNGYNVSKPFLLENSVLFLEDLELSGVKTGSVSGEWTFAV